jgi:hypothetical protein
MDPIELERFHLEDEIRNFNKLEWTEVINHF